MALLEQLSIMQQSLWARTLRYRERRLSSTATTPPFIIQGPGFEIRTDSSQGIHIRSRWFLFEIAHIRAKHQEIPLLFNLLVIFNTVFHTHMLTLHQARLQKYMEYSLGETLVLSLQHTQLTEEPPLADHTLSQQVRQDTSWAIWI